MSTQTARPLSLQHVDFDNLYARHLGRHSQFGINLGHLTALFGLWFGVYAALYQAILLSSLPAGYLVIGALALSYLVMVAVNAPYQVVLATAGFLTVFVASIVALPRLPSWSILAFIAIIPVFYKVQSSNHKIWTIAADMTEFNKQFPPGLALTLILLIYEVPLCLNYLVFRRQDWRR
jgi:hypothetical protein